MFLSYKLIYAVLIVLVLRKKQKSLNNIENFLKKTVIQGFKKIINFKIILLSHYKNKKCRLFITVFG
jgi:hypothetical protein